MESRSFDAYDKVDSVPMKGNEPIIEGAVLTWFSALGNAAQHQPHLAASEPAAERVWFRDVVG